MKFFSMTASLAIEATEAVKYGKSEWKAIEGSNNIMFDKNIGERVVNNKSILRIWSLNYEKWLSTFPTSFQFCTQGKYFSEDYTVYLCLNL